MRRTRHKSRTKGALVFWSARKGSESPADIMVAIFPENVGLQS